MGKSTFQSYTPVSAEEAAYIMANPSQASGGLGDIIKKYGIPAATAIFAPELAAAMGGGAVGGAGAGALIGGGSAALNGANLKQTLGAGLLGGAAGGIMGSGMLSSTPASVPAEYASLYADGLGGVAPSSGNWWDQVSLGNLLPSNTATNPADAYGMTMRDGTTMGTTATPSGNWLNSLVGSGSTNGLLSGALTIGGGLLAGNSAVDAAQTSSDAQIRAAQIAAESAKFRPVGITTNFGSSNFTKDAQGNVTGAGYTLSPEMLAQQAKLMGVSEQALQQYLGAQGATAPMGEAASRMMTLGNSYLATTPQEQAAKYMADQQALLATGRERDVNNMLTGEYNRGTYGLSVGGTSTGMNAANPRLEAMFNAQRQQDLGLAAQATQGGMDYAKFGGAMTGLGGSMLRDMYGTQTAAYDPYKTALGGATSAEALGQDSLKLGMDMGSTVTAANAASGRILGQGMTNAATTMQNYNAYSPWGAMLSGVGDTIKQYNNPQQNWMFNPLTGKPL